MLQMLFHAILCPILNHRRCSLSRMDSMTRRCVSQISEPSLMTAQRASTSKTFADMLKVTKNTTNSGTTSSMAFLIIAISSLRHARDTGMSANTLLWTTTWLSPTHPIGNATRDAVTVSCVTPGLHVYQATGSASNLLARHR